MADPRATARQWLAEIIDEHTAMGANARDIADAILTAPGVEVGIQARAVATSGYSFNVPSMSEHATHTQVVIRLPAQPNEGTR